MTQALRNHLLRKQETDKCTHRPEFFRLEQAEDCQRLQNLLETDVTILVHDEFEAQLRELIRSGNPQDDLSDSELDEAIRERGNLSKNGVWVYYPWLHRLVHILDELEFIELRTNRNLHKITRAERDALAMRSVGIIGLSVGRSIALTLALERSCGELRLADFDALELSNLNRLQAGVHELGLPKVVSVAREIAEIDPFLKVVCFDKGITSDNIDVFMAANGRIDVLIDECDSLEIKFLAREKAKERGIPVLMHTSDAGMMDVERFDLEPDRSIFHGRTGKLNANDIAHFGNEERFSLIHKIVNSSNSSVRIKAYTAARACSSGSGRIRHRT